ncbi:hypothetical protein B0J12DRAFT_207667 [Macrophomina phaseolina]|uniref:Uncharacterized protein n=1 Tax=Macrophomina phaseolina TaxID=35725 RepID=A0ABQ8G2B6_9PEZI|nr:hypothetical protein B0J12DRAFT_207667 [Macrophomina phaseolina]
MQGDSRAPRDVIDLGSDQSAEPSDAEPSDAEPDSDDATGMSDGEESVVGTRDFENLFLDVLDSIWSSNSGTFAHSAPISDAVFKDPKIHVDSIGTISLPLSSEDAERLSGLCQNAEMPPGSFQVKNPLWDQRVLPALVGQVIRELGIEGNESGIGAQIRKMELCAHGQRPEYKNRENTPGLIATLVVCLPSPHEGGHVHTSLESMKRELRVPEDQPYFMCWYHDVEQGTEDVTSGYRWALVYDVINFEQPDFAPSAERVSHPLNSLHDIFRSWKLTSDELEQRYIYVLTDTYEGPSLNIDMLRGGDLQVARALKEMGSQDGFTVFLARIESRKRGTVLVSEWEDDLHDFGTVHEMESVHQEHLLLKQVASLYGRTLVDDVSIQKNQILQEDWTVHHQPEEDDLEDIYYGGDAIATHIFEGVVGTCAWGFWRALIDRILPGPCHHTPSRGDEFSCPQRLPARCRPKLFA